MIFKEYPQGYKTQSLLPTHIIKKVNKRQVLQKYKWIDKVIEIKYSQKGVHYIDKNQVLKKVLVNLPLKRLKNMQSKYKDYRNCKMK